jgi:hypothetical protein
MPRRPKPERKTEDDLRAANARIRELEHEVERLTRKVARERKHARHPTEDVDPEPVEVPEVKTGCPTCGSPILDFPNVYKTIHICSNKLCGWRKVM